MARQENGQAGVVGTRPTKAVFLELGFFPFVLHYYWPCEPLHQFYWCLLALLRAQSPPTKSIWPPLATPQSHLRENICFEFPWTGTRQVATTLSTLKTQFSDERCSDPLIASKPGIRRISCGMSKTGFGFTAGTLERRTGRTPQATRGRGSIIRRRLRFHLILSESGLSSFVRNQC